MLNILTKYGICNVSLQATDRPDLLATDNGRRFKVRSTVATELQLSLFVFEAGGYFAKGVQI